MLHFDALEDPCVFALVGTIRRLREQASCHTGAAPDSVPHMLPSVELPTNGSMRGSTVNKTGGPQAALVRRRVLGALPLFSRQPIAQQLCQHCCCQQCQVEVTRQASGHVLSSARLHLTVHTHAHTSTCIQAREWAQQLLAWKDNSCTYMCTSSHNRAGNAKALTHTSAEALWGRTDCLRSHASLLRISPVLCTHTHTPVRPPTRRTP